MPKFLEQAIASCHSEYPLHFLTKVSRQLRSPEILEDNALRLLLLCFISLRNIEKLCTLELPEGTGLVRSLVIACQRQMCSSSAFVRELYVVKVVETVG